MLPLASCRPWPRGRYDRAASGALVHDGVRGLARLHCHLTFSGHGLGGSELVGGFIVARYRNQAFSINLDVYLVQNGILRAVAALQRPFLDAARAAFPANFAQAH
jgi:hypothetical protein